MIDFLQEGKSSKTQVLFFFIKMISYYIASIHLCSLELQENVKVQL